MDYVKAACLCEPIFCFFRPLAKWCEAGTLVERASQQAQSRFVVDDGWLVVSGYSFALRRSPIGEDGFKGSRRFKSNALARSGPNDLPYGVMQLPGGGQTPIQPFLREKRRSPKATYDSDDGEPDYNTRSMNGESTFVGG
jgi:hypothetical protein